MCACFFQHPNTYAATSRTYFARIKYSNAYLYKTATQNSSSDNIYFNLPQSYFVEVISKPSADFFEAKYLDQVGFVKKSDIEFVSGTPVNPYADKVSFRVFAQNGLNLRSTPFESEGISNRITTIPFLETNLRYIGQIEGEEAISNRGNVWYYCNYYRLDEVLTGYVYAGYCDMLSSIPQNTEQLSVIEEPSFEKLVENQSSTSDLDNTINKLPQKTQIIIIIAVSLPALLILYLLFKPAKLIASSKATKKSSDTKKKRKRYHDDYYEIED